MLTRLGQEFCSDNANKTISIDNTDVVIETVRGKNVIPDAKSDLQLLKTNSLLLILLI